MNCMEFRRTASGNRPLGVGQARHALRCDACRRFHARGARFEADIRDALAVEVSSCAREQAVRIAAASSRRVRRAAFGASLLMAVAVVWLLSALQQPDPLARAGIDFVMFEEAQVIVEAPPADIKVLAGVSRRMGVSLPAQLGELRYVGICPFAGEQAHHALVSTPHGKLTLLLLPERAVRSRAQASAHGLVAAIMPASTGSIAIIGASKRAVARAKSILAPAASGDGST
jgi:hypothetical protein